MRQYNRDDTIFEVPDFTVNTEEDNVILTIIEGEYSGVSFTFHNLNMETDDMLTFNLQVLSEEYEDNEDFGEVAKNILLGVLYDVFDNLENLTNDGEISNV